MTNQSEKQNKKSPSKVSLTITFLCIVFLFLKFTGLLQPLIDMFK